MNTRLLNPHIAVHCVLFGFDLEDLQVLVMGPEPTKQKAGGSQQKTDALPGDLIYDYEDLDACARRILGEVIGRPPSNFTQFGAFGDPTRLGRLAEQRVVSIGYYSLIQLDEFEATETNKKASTHWVPLHSIEHMIFDHDVILQRAKQSLRMAMHERPIIFHLLPPRFTLAQVQKLYEVIYDRDLDKRNFRRKILKLGILKELDEKQVGVAHKPARYYTIDEAALKRLKARGLDQLR